MESYVRLARQQAPDPLSTSQLDALSGAIGWPAALRKPEYDALRQQLDKLFQQRAGGHLDYLAIHDNCEKMLALLKGEVMALPSNEYLAARTNTHASTPAAPQLDGNGRDHADAAVDDSEAQTASTAAENEDV